MIEIVLVFISTVLILRGVLTLFFLVNSLIWIKKNECILKNKHILNKPKIVVIIPVLHEQKRILGTLEYFVKYFVSNNVSIVVVSTQKEYTKNFIGLSTKEVVDNYIKKNGLGGFIQCIDYPDKNGLMAHQLNFAIDQIEDDNSFIAVYNADSRPHPETINYFYSLINKNPSVKVVQQSAAFIKNFDYFNKFGNNIKKLFLKSCALLQTRWTLAHEYPRLIRESSSKIKFVRRFANTHVVGHGLIIQANVIKKIGGFPTSNVTEDLFLGFLLRSRGYTVYPFPLLELADSPESLSANWKQKYVWFWGPMKYFTYFKYVTKIRTKLKLVSILTLVAFMFQGLISAVAWLISGFIVCLCFLSPILTKNLEIILFCYLSIIIYGPFQYFIVYKNLPFLFKFGGDSHKKDSFIEMFIVSIFSVVTIIFHSIPPYFSIYTEIKHKITKQEIYKPKTE